MLISLTCADAHNWGLLKTLMPEDNSDDSSIPDCCRSKQVTIRNQYNMHNLYQQRRFWTYGQISGLRIGYDLNFGYVHFTRFAKIMTVMSVTMADVFAHRSSEKEAGLRGKILLFFTSGCKVSAQKSEKFFDGIMSALNKADQAFSRLPRGRIFLQSKI